MMKFIWSYLTIDNKKKFKKRRSFETCEIESYKVYFLSVPSVKVTYYEFCIPTLKFKYSLLEVMTYSGRFTTLDKESVS